MAKNQTQINPRLHKFTMAAFMELGGSITLSPVQTQHLELNPSQTQPRESRRRWRNEGEGHRDKKKTGCLYTRRLCGKDLRRALSDHDEGMGTVQGSLFRSLLYRQKYLKCWDETQRYSRSQQQREKTTDQHSRVEYRL